MLINTSWIMNSLKSYRVTAVEENLNVEESLKNYRFRFVWELEELTITDVVAPDRCRTYHRRGSQPDTILIGKSLYVHEGVGDSYFESNRSDYATCTPGFTEFDHALPTLIEAKILGDDKLEVHEVVRLRYNFIPTFPEGRIPLGGANSSWPGSEVWIEKPTGRILKLIMSTAEPDLYSLYSRFNEPVTPPIEKPAKIVPPPTIGPTPTFVPLPLPTGSPYYHPSTIAPLPLSTISPYHP
jgi:hypothetical protein